MRELKKFLEERGVNPSYHRLKILEYLSKNRTHPTVEEIYSELSRRIPTLSKTTVYNTLNLFLEKGIVQALTIDERVLRYDSTTSLHTHFMCIECGVIYDVKLNSHLFEQKLIEGHKITECQIYLKGICKNCLS